MKSSVRDRIKVTRTGKLLRRPMGVGHSLAKKTGKQKRQSKNRRAVAAVDRGALQRYGQE